MSLPLNSEKHYTVYFNKLQLIFAMPLPRTINIPDRDIKNECT